MKRTFYYNAITLLTGSVLLCLVVFWTQAQAQKKTTPRPTPTPTPEKKIKIADTILRREGKNKIILKPGFEAAKQADNSITVRRFTAGTKSGLGVEGKFSCDCLGTKGTCNTFIQGPSLECSGSCDECLLTVVIK
ncbi:MAG TPA: hypothetical protein VFZ34_29195 [Blastocatellia bacterium]|nr:hypothetical protein [Blastocatellia bacterium]